MIFSEERYFQTNEIPNYHHFVWNAAHSQASIEIPLSIQSQEAISIPKAPYAGLWIQHQPDEQDTKDFLASLTQFLKAKDVQTLHIKQSPDFFHTPIQNAIIHEILKLGGKQSMDINHHIDLLNLKDQEIHNMQWRRIRKCQNAGFRFQKEANTETDTIYDFLNHCRNQQGLEVNVTKNHFIRLIDHMPDEYAIYTIRDSNDQLLACTVTIKVTPHIIYNYLPAFDRKFANYSPLAFLTYQLIQDLKESGVHYLDLGISSLSGKPQHSLIQFKERMGGIRSERATYILHI